MKGVKFCCIFAVLGFLLSFISGLFSHTSILSVFLKALLFAIIFGLLGFLVSFIFEKFLSDGSGGDFSGDSEVFSGSANQAPATGRVVDITIQDEDLASGDSDNHFIVGDKHQMLNPSDYKGNNHQASDSSREDDGFVPLKRTETLKDLSGKEAFSPDDVQTFSGKTSEPPSFSNSSNSDEGIDTLPDMGNLEFEESGSSESNDDDADIGSSSDFVSSSSSHQKSDKVPDIKDAALMAKAISSALSDDNSL